MSQHDNDNNNNNNEQDEQQQNEMQIQMNEMKQIIMKQEIIKPISPYIIFITDWKQKHHDKLNIKEISKLWNQLTKTEKQYYQMKFKQQKNIYIEQQANIQINNPQMEENSDYLFPLHRIKAITKQDKYYTPKTQAICCLSKATHAFAKYLLQEVKHLTEGKNRVEVTDLFQSISIHQTTLGFLNCVAEQYNLEEHKKTNQTTPKQEGTKSKRSMNKNNKGVQTQQTRLTNIFLQPN